MTPLPAPARLPRLIGSRAKLQTAANPTPKGALMINRRMLIAGIASLAFTASAFAEDWKAKYPELTFAVVPAENASGVTERYTPFVNYLSKELGIKVKLRVANDYAAVIEGQRAGNIQIGYYGPASFARARLTGVKTDAFVIDVNSDGSKGYYSVFYVMAKSPYQKIEDLKGKNLGLVDPNSTSGNNMPRFKLNKLGIDPDTFFSQVVFTGSHENAVLALAQGTVDVAANWWNARRRFQPDAHAHQGHGEERRRHADEEGRLPHHRQVRPDHQLALRLSLRSARRPEGRDQARRSSTRRSKDKDAFEKLSDGKNQPWEPITTEDYDKTIELIKFVDSLRKKSS